MQIRIPNPEKGKTRYLGELDGLSRSLEAFPGALKSFIEA
jgi:hypothetical protein